MTSTSHKQAETIFCALDQLDKLEDCHTASQKVSFQELFHYATQKTYQPSPLLQEALGKDLRLRQDLKRLLEKDCLAYLPRAAAASSGDILEREANGYLLRLKISQAAPDQVYLLIQSVDRDESPQFLFVYPEEGAPLRLVIEDFDDAEAQILLSLQDDVVKALRDYKSEVILK